MFETFFWPKTVTHNVKCENIAEDLLSNFSAPPQKIPLQILSKDQNINKRFALFTWSSSLWFGKIIDSYSRHEKK